MSANMYPAMRHLMDHHAEPEVTGEPESEPKTIMPEITTPVGFPDHSACPLSGEAPR